MSLTLSTPRLRLRTWKDQDRDGFAAMCADPEVMADYGKTLSREESDEKLARYANAFEQVGYGRWVVTDYDDRFLGYCGVMPGYPGHPLGEHDEIGWRLIRDAWGHGFATEAAQTALRDIFARTDIHEVLAYTTDENARSQSVMRKLQLTRAPERDFQAHNDIAGFWQGRVWVAATGTSQDLGSMPIPTTRAELLQQITAEFGKLDTEIRALNPADAEIVCTETWTIKDLLAVRLWWTHSVLNWVHQGLNGKVPKLPAPGYGWNQTPQLNAAIIDKAENRVLRDIVRDLRRQYRRLLATIDLLDDRQLLRVGTFEWAGRYPVSRWLSINTARQYHTARQLIRRAGHS